MYENMTYLNHAMAHLKYNHSEKINPVISNVESKIRAHFYYNSIRMVDLFEDFDKLRSGYMTIPQFRRCLNTAYGRTISPPFTDSEFNLIANHYCKRGDGMVKWTDFVESISQGYVSKKTEPSNTASDPEIVSEPFKALIDKIKNYVKHHGSDIKSWFRDFDKHHNGVVTYNQFKRGIPPHFLTLKEQDLLINQYGDPSRGVANYFIFNSDVTRQVGPFSVAPKLVDVPPSEDSDIPIGTESLLLSANNYLPVKLNLNDIEEKLKKQVYKERIRLLEFFKDWDRHNCGLISENQFRSVLLPLLHLNLELKEIDMIVAHYQIKDKRIRYRDFCDSINSVFTINNLEKMPTLQVKAPPLDFLVQVTNKLSSQDESQCQALISRLSKIMSERRLIMAPFFKDFDKNLGNMGTVTRSHFSRIMSTFRIDLSDTEMHLVFKKFEDKKQGKVNYMEFIKAIDSETYINNKNKPATPVSRSQTADSESQSVCQVTWESTLSNIRQYVLTRRVRVAEFFKNFDKLRTYSIPEREFCRGVNTIGYPITTQEYDTLAIHYADHLKKGCCKWREFQQDVEAGDHDVYRSTVNAFKSGLPLTPQETELLEKTMDSIRGYIVSRQTSIKPFFKDFDKLCSGHVSKSQFRQCLTYLQCDVSEKEFEVICKNWVKLDGSQPHRDFIKDKSDRICYIPFLESLSKGTDSADVSINPKVHGKSRQRPLTDSETQNLLLRVKIKCKRERIRVIDFMQDFDHLRHGSITKNEFYRAVKVLFPELTEVELNALERLFENEKDDRYVNYIKFSDKMEESFTKKGLEKNPTAVPSVFNLVADAVNRDAVKKLNENDEIVYVKVMNRLAKKIKQKRIDYLSYFEDFDFVREGTITKNQFRAVLNIVRLDVEEYEIDVISRKFDHFDRIFYRTFSSLLQEFIDAIKD